MEHAKKLVLVEPRLLEQLQINNEYKEIQKPADLKSKSHASMDVRSILDEDGIGDDIKAKKYQQAFSRYQNLKNVVPPSEKIKINPLTELRLKKQKQRGRRTAGTPRKWSPY